MTVSENRGLVTFTVVASPPPSGDLTVNLARSGTATPVDDYSQSGLAGTDPSYMLTVGTAAAATFTVTTVLDRVTDDGETIVFTLAAGTGYTLGADTMASISIDDVPDDPDTDGDGTPDSIDLDDDADGIPDTADDFPLDTCARTDTDGDGDPDNIVPPGAGCVSRLTEDLDDDNDGIPDTADDFPLDTCASTDTDGDGDPDSIVPPGAGCVSSLTEDTDGR